MHIDLYNFGQIMIDGREYDSDVIVFSDHVQSNWRRKDGHSLCIADLKEVFDVKPKIIIVGTGHSGLMQVSPELLAYFKENNIQLIALNTALACKEFNELLKTGHPAVVAALHLTC